VPNSQHALQTQERERHSLRAVDLGLAANTLLALVKTGVGVLGNSQALLADGINSVSDVIYYVVVRVFMVFARQPADDDHPFGHERLESIGALVVGSFVVATGVAVLLDASHGFVTLLGDGAVEAVAPLALWVALGTIALKIVLFLFTRRVSRITSNPAVAALAMDHRNDILSAGAAALGILAVRLGLPWADPLAGALVALVILRTGIGILRESSADLMGGQLGQDIHARLSTWLAQVPGVLTVEELRAHSFGPYLVLELTVGVDGTISVAEGDAIADAIEALLFERVEFLRAVHVHVHPARRLATAGPAAPAR
jgi:cation diffusion facilitator family transporter